MQGITDHLGGSRGVLDSLLASFLLMCSPPDAQSGLVRVDANGKVGEGVERGWDWGVCLSLVFPSSLIF